MPGKNIPFVFCPECEGDVDSNEDDHYLPAADGVSHE